MMTKKSVMLRLVVLTGAVLAMTGCKGMCGSKTCEASSGMKSEMPVGQHPAGCTCEACTMKK